LLPSGISLLTLRIFPICRLSGLLPQSADQTGSAQDGKWEKRPCLDITALHNHFFFENPRVMFLHISGQAKADDLARGVRRCLDKIRDIRAASPTPAVQFPGSEIPSISRIAAGPIDKILGVKGQSSGGMYKAVLERHARMHGRQVSGEMGTETWAGFAGIDDNALMTGEFAMTTAELQPVVRILRDAGINILAIHNHMTQEEPQFVFLQYWGKGNTVKLAKAVRPAIDKVTANSATHIGHQAH